MQNVFYGKWLGDSGR